MPFVTVPLNPSPIRRRPLFLYARAGLPWRRLADGSKADEQQERNQRDQAIEDGRRHGFAQPPGPDSGGLRLGGRENAQLIGPDNPAASA